jgi:hypothetical protein
MRRWYFAVGAKELLLYLATGASTLGTDGV